MKKYWKRILIAGIATEILYGVFIFVILGSAETAYEASGLSGAAAFFLVGGFLAARNIDSRHALLGALVAVVAVVLYTLLTIPALINGTFHFTGLVALNHGLKIMGGAAGGFIAGTPFFRKKPQAS